MAFALDPFCRQEVLLIAQAPAHRLGLQTLCLLGRQWLLGAGGGRLQGADAATWAKLGLGQLQSGQGAGLNFWHPRIWKRQGPWASCLTDIFQAPEASVWFGRASAHSLPWLQPSTSGC